MAKIMYGNYNDLPWMPNHKKDVDGKVMCYNEVLRDGSSQPAHVHGKNVQRYAYRTSHPSQRTDSYLRKG